jgi:hypothetical protein
MAGGAPAALAGFDKGLLAHAAARIEQDQTLRRRRGVMRPAFNQELAVRPLHRRTEAGRKALMSGCYFTVCRIDDLESVGFFLGDEHVQQASVAARADQAAVAELVLLANRELRGATAPWHVEYVQIGILIVNPEMIFGNTVRADAVRPWRHQPVAAVGVADNAKIFIERLNAEHASPTRLQPGVTVPE